MRKHRIKNYTEAAREYAEFLEDKGSDLNDVMIFGEKRAEGEPSKFTWQEADDKLMNLTQQRMKKTGEDYETARNYIEADPGNREVVRSYQLSG